MILKKCSVLPNLINFFIAVSVSDLNDDDGAGGSSKSNSVNSIHSTGISASSQVTFNITFVKGAKKNFSGFSKASSTNSLPVGGVGTNQGDGHVDNHQHLQQVKRI